MRMSYRLKRDVPLGDDSILLCDKGKEGMQNMMVEIGRIQYGFLGKVLMWTLSRFCYRKITKEEIEYNFYFLP